MQGSKPIKAVAYARVSTLLGQDPENQLVPIRQFSEARGFPLLKEYVDVGISGTKERRPALDEMMCDARQGRFKIVIVAALDRVSRSTRHFLSLVQELSLRKIQLISLRENLDFTTPTGEMVLTVLAAVSTLERQILSDRIRVSLMAKKIAAAKTGSKWRAGRPNVITEPIIIQVLEFRKQGHSIRQIERMLNKSVSRTSIERILRNHRQGSSGVPG